MIPGREPRLVCARVCHAGSRGSLGEYSTLFYHHNPPSGIRLGHSSRCLPFRIFEILSELSQLTLWVKPWK